MLGQDFKKIFILCSFETHGSSKLTPYASLEGYMLGYFLEIKSPGNYSLDIKELRAIFNEF